MSANFYSREKPGKNATKAHSLRIVLIYLWSEMDSWSHLNDFEICRLFALLM